jgi:hypothetical protein
MGEVPDGGLPDGGDRRSARLVAVAVLAAVLFGWPFLVVFDQPVRVLGAPLLWLWLLGAWAAVIALVAAAVRDPWGG